MERHVTFCAILGLFVLSLPACGGEATPRPTPAPPPSPTPAPPPSALVPIVSDVGDAGAQDAGDLPMTPADKPPSACPSGMALVDTTYCPKPKLRCLKSEYDKSNHITICHSFSTAPQTCLVEERRQRYCIDKYEYPNKEGGHPPVMVSWYDALAACEGEGKRLCFQSEWEAACEGPEKLPFPYGHKRDPEKCNIDNAYVKPFLDRVYSSDKAVQGAELLRLDRSVPSGSKAGCVSGFGVHDLTGNVDEWVNSEENRGKSKWAGLKGGAWGHVRNACRPMTVSHPADFTYYFISFRCCKDALSDPNDKGAKIWSQPQPKHSSATPISKGWAPAGR